MSAQSKAAADVIILNLQWCIEQIDLSLEKGDARQRIQDKLDHVKRERERETI